MAGAHQPITIKANDAEIQSAFKALLAAGKNLNPVLQEIGEKLLQSTRQRFVDSRDPEGNLWAQNSDVTLLRAIGGGLSKKATKTGGHTLTKPGMTRIASKKVLVLRGHLRDSLRYQANSGSVLIGTNREYGAAQQFGMTKGYAGNDRRGHPVPWGNIPPRPFLGISAADKNDVIAILRDHLVP